MAFDLYFAGARNKTADDFLLEKGAHRLQSQLIDRSNIEVWRKEKKPESKLFVDSGAYTAYTKGVVLSVDDYIDYLNSITEDVTIFAQLDTIPGRFNQPKTLEEIQNAPRLSWENYLYMRERLLEPDKLIPIFHQGEDFKWLENMLEWIDNDGKPIGYIGVSPAMDVPGLEPWLIKCFNIIAKSSNPNVKTHAFGMTQLSVLEQFPYTSADSTSWKLCAAMGSIYTPWGTIYISDRGAKDTNGLASQPKHLRDMVKEYVESLGFDFAEAQQKDTIRYLINITFLLDWAKNYTYKGGDFKERPIQTNLF